jgi:hypothetical protein
MTVTTLLNVLPGIAGWFAMKMIGEPLLRIPALRMDVQATLILYDDGAFAAAAERTVAARRLRKLGGALIASHLGTGRWVRWSCRVLLGWDPYRAGVTCMDVGRRVEIGWPPLDAAAEMLAIRARLALPAHATAAG